MSHHRQYIVDNGHNKSILDGIYVLQQSSLGHLLGPCIVGKHRQTAANNHRDRKANRPSQNTNETIDHHKRSTENNQCATFDQALISHAHQDHLNRWHIVLMKRLHFEVVVLVLVLVMFSLYLVLLKWK